MEPLLVFLTTWWWAAPTVAGLGAIGYAGLTTGRRRSRRLALDAARHEERNAVQRLLQAQADTRSAQAVVLSAQAAQRGAYAAGAPSVSEARRELQRAKQAQRAASLSLKASRAQVRAERVRMHGTAADDLPLARVMAEHDALMARWLEYETDLETSLAFPQMSDPHHPATAAFLQAQQVAGHRRPASSSARMSAEEFVAYRSAVRAASVAFDAAEDAALRASATRGTLPRPGPAARPPAAPPAAAAEEPRPPIWPVPRRNPGPPSAS